MLGEISLPDKSRDFKMRELLLRLRHIFKNEEVKSKPGGVTLNIPAHQKN